MTSQLKLLVLGLPRVEIDDVPVTIHRRKATALLIYLGVTQHIHSRETLATLLWPDVEQARAYTYLRVVLLELNRSLGREWLEVDREMVGIRHDARVWLDFNAFHDLVSGAQAPVAQLEQAVQLYQGDFLEGFTLPDSPDFDEWQYFQRESARRELSEGLKQLVQTYTQRAEYPKAISHAKRWLALDFLNEAAHRELMQLYSWSGQRSAALRQHEECAAYLERELGIQPEAETEALFQAIQDDALSAPAAPAAPPVAVTLDQRAKEPIRFPALIGRERDQDEIVRLLRDPACRLVTLTGPGGVGKTRLAELAGATVASTYEHGVFFVSLAAASSTGAVIRAIGDALHLDPANRADLKTQIISWLATKHALVVLDDFEHRLDSALFAAEILQAAPQVTLLVTSMEKLGLEEEVIFQVRGLDYPTSRHPERSLLDYSAVRLFVQCAQQNCRDFDPEDGMLRDVGRICQIVDGNPLGIVLAAAWMDMLAPAEVVQELDHNLDVLAADRRDLPERHRSMRALFDSSWNLLDDHERAVLMRLAVFRGPFTRSAAEKVARASLKTLRGLVSKSLIQPAPGRSHYFLHTLLHQYLDERLAASEEADAVRAAHSAYYAGFLQHSLADLKGMKQAATLDAIELEFEDIRAAWGWAVEQRRYATINRALESLYLFAIMRGYWHEVEALVRHARETLIFEVDGTPAEWHKLLTYFNRESPDACVQIEAAMKTAQAEKSRAAVAHCYQELGWWALHSKEYDEARQFLESGVAEYHTLQDAFYEAMLLRGLALCYVFQGEFEQAIHFNRQSLDLNRSIGNRIGVAENLSMHGMLTLVRGNHESAAQWLQEAHKLQRDLRSRLDMIESGVMLAWLDLLGGKLDECRSLAHTMQELAAEIRHSQGQGAALLLLAVADMLEGRPARAEETLGESLLLLDTTESEYWSSSINLDLRLFIAWACALIYCGLGDCSQAQNTLAAVFNHEIVSHSPMFQQLFSPLTALAFAHQNEIDQAARWLDASFRSPHALTGWLHHWDLITDLRAQVPAVETGEFPETLEYGQLPLEKEMVTMWWQDALPEY